MIESIGNVRGYEVPISCREAHKRLQDAGAYQVPRRGKGSHELWKHTLVPDGFVTLPCHGKGTELSPPAERQLQRFLQLIRERSTL